MIISETLTLSLRELLEKEQSQGLLQAGLEEQLDTVRQSLQEQNSAAHSLHSELKAQLENIQKQVTQVINTRHLVPGYQTEFSFSFTTFIHPNSYSVVFLPRSSVVSDILVPPMAE